MPEEHNIVVNPLADQVRLFMLYCLFGGDCKRVSVVSRVPVNVVQSYEHDFNWKERASGHFDTDSDEGRENEQKLNRTSVYVTATLMSQVFDNLAAELSRDPSFARSFCTQLEEDGSTRFNTKNLVELAKGLEILANVRYRALGDKLARDADTTGKPENVSAIALNVYAQLANKFDRHAAIDTASEIKRVVELDAKEPSPAGE